MAMNVSFKDFQVERDQSCKFDYVKIGSDQSDKYGVYCGEKTGESVLVNGKYVVITFHSDGNFHEKGFLLHFTAVPVGNKTTTPNVCGSVINSTVKSPGYPNNYPNGTDCTYVIAIPRGKRMNISFYDFDVEHEPAWCGFDYLKIITITNGNNCDLGKHCGVKTGQTALVSGDYAVLMFHSDRDGQRKGFLLFFTTVSEAIVISSTHQATTLTTTFGPQNDSIPTKAPGNTNNFSNSTDTKGLSTLVIVVIAVGGSMTAVIIGVAVLCYIRRRRRDKRKNNNNMLQKESQRNDKWEVKSEDVTVYEELGQGAFGKVCKGIMKVHSLKKRANTTITVAVKMLQEDATPDQKKDFLDEIKLVKTVGSHKNIVSLIGCCIKSSPNFLIVEFASKGDLLSYLRERRKKVKSEAYVQVRESLPPPTPPRLLHQRITGSYEIGNDDIGQVNVAFSTTNSSTDLIINIAQSLSDEEQDQELDEDEDDSLTPKDMMSFSWQIAQGMQYLSGKKIIHRDLAARNVLVCDNKLVKIADFGLARSTVRENVYRGTGQHNRLPLKWMPPEAVNDGVFTTKSDVWSYGILLWEIATLGGFPYPGIRNRELMRLLKRGYRMEKPDTCSEEFYQLMTRCWADNPDARPTFTELCQELEDWMQRDAPYLDIDQLDEDQPYYDTTALSASSGSSFEEHNSDHGPSLNTTTENLPFNDKDAILKRHVFKQTSCPTIMIGFNK
ncbi:uncharacterized protein LOC144646412 isoform X5 [Oculina patagonica]